MGTRAAHSDAMKNRRRPTIKAKRPNAARRQNLGRVKGRRRLDVCLHAPGHRRATVGSGMSKRILVVEDQPDNRQIIRDMLAPTDYEITEAENGEEALAAIAKQRPDLILMDIQLPQSGLQSV